MASIPPSYHNPSTSRSTNSSSLHSSVQKALKLPGIHNVLDGLGIKPENLSKIVTSQGRFEQPMKGIESMSMIQIQPDHAQLLASLGLGSIESALVIHAESEIKKTLKKALKEIKKSTLDPKDISKLLQALGITGRASNIVFSDGQGGLVILQTAIQEIESLLEQDDDDEEEPSD